MGLTEKQLKDFADYMKPPRTATPTITINATVHSIDDSGERPVYYVNFDGAEDQEPCPVSSTIAEGDTTLKENDRVVVLVQDRQGTIIGNITQPMKSSEYDDSWIDPAIDDAKKVATNYLHYSVADGFIVSANAASPNTGRNVQIVGNGVYVRNGTNDLASFTATLVQLGQDNTKNIVVTTGSSSLAAGIHMRNASTELAYFGDTEIELGMSSASAVIRFCNDCCRLQYDSSDAAGYGTKGLTLNSDTGIVLDAYGTSWNNYVLIRDKSTQGQYALNLNDMNLIEIPVTKDNISISANSYVTVNIDVPTYYQGLAVHVLSAGGFDISNASSSGKNASNCFLFALKSDRTSGAAIYAQIGNAGSSAAKVKLSVRPLCIIGGPAG